MTVAHYYATFGLSTFRTAFSKCLSISECNRFLVPFYTLRPYKLALVGAQPNGGSLNLMSSHLIGTVKVSPRLGRSGTKQQRRLDGSSFNFLMTSSNHMPSYTLPRDCTHLSIYALTSV